MHPATQRRDVDKATETQERLPISRSASNRGWGGGWYELQTKLRLEEDAPCDLHSPAETVDPAGMVPPINNGELSVCQLQVLVMQQYSLVVEETHPESRD